MDDDPREDLPSPLVPTQMSIVWVIWSRLTDINQSLARFSWRISTSLTTNWWSALLRFPNYVLFRTRVMKTYSWWISPWRYQQDETTPHYVVEIKAYIYQVFPKRWIGHRGEIECPASFVDLTLVHFPQQTKQPKFRIFFVLVKQHVTLLIRYWWHREQKIFLRFEPKLN